MIEYPIFRAAVERVGIEPLAELADIKAAVIVGILERGMPPSLELADRFAAALETPVEDLFRLDDDLEVALAAAPTRYVTDPAVLRIIDGVLS